MKKAKRERWLLPLLGALLLISLLCALRYGSSALSFAALWEVLRTGDRLSADYRIFVYVRLPRVLAALGAGMALSVSGVILQGVFQNPLAGPNIIGVSAGAGLGAMLVMALCPGGTLGVPLAAFLGALGAALLVSLLSGKVLSHGQAVLVGVAVSSLCSAGMDALRTLYPEAAAYGSGFLIGGLAGVSMRQLLPALGLIAAALPVAWVQGRRLDILSLGDEEAAALGVNVRRSRFFFLVLASLLAGAAVSFAGLLGFVGLLVPHIVRPFAYAHRRLIPAAALAGGCLVLLCDLLSRVLFAPYELPVGILLSAIGAPGFLILLLRKGRRDAL